MGKILINFLLLFTIIQVHSQNITNIPSDIVEGTSYTINVSMSTPPNCTMQIKFEIGNIKVIGFPTGVNFNSQTNTANFPLNSSTSAVSQNFNLNISLPRGAICTPQVINFKATFISSCLNSPNVVVQQNINATMLPPITVSDVNFIITRDIDYQPNVLYNCKGRLNKYIIKIYRGAPIQYTSGKVFLELPTCLVNEMVFSNIYNPVLNFTNLPSNTPNMSILSWVLNPNELISLNNNSQLKFQLYFNSPCDNSLCVNGNQSMRGYVNVKADSYLCQTLLDLNSNPVVFPLGNMASDCQQVCPIYEKPKVNVTGNGQCTTICGIDSSTLSMDLEIPPLNYYNNNFDLIFNIPSGIRIKEIGVYSSAGSGGVIIANSIPPNASCFTTFQAKYGGGGWNDINQTLTITDLSSLNVTDIKYRFGCNDLEPGKIIGIYIRYEFNNTVTILPTSIPYQIVFDNATLPVSTGEVKFPTCPLISLTKIARRSPNSPIPSDIYLGGNYNPTDIVTFGIEIKNLSKLALNNITVRDILDSRFTYLNNFKYAYSDSSGQPAFVNLTGNQLPTTLGLGSPTVTFSPMVGPNPAKIEIIGLNMPNTCTAPKTLWILFDAQIEAGLLAGTQINNTVNVYNNESVIMPLQYPNTNNTTLTIRTLKQVTAKMFVKCQNVNIWEEDNQVDVRAGEIIDFKMQFKNTGTLPVKLMELINTKPQIGDTFEFPVQTLRLSQFEVAYNCSPIIISPSTYTANFRYSNQQVNIFNGSTPNWQICNPNLTNSFDIEFPGGGAIVNPSQVVEITYSGKVSGSSGQIAKNTFSFKAEEIDSTPFASQNSNIITINNNGQGCFPPPPCYDCSSFDLVKKSKYLVSGWVREEDPATPEKQFKNYLSSIKISFTDINGAPITANQVDLNTGETIVGSPEFFATGDIIDGWQRIVGEFFVPDNVDDMKLELVNKNPTGTMAYFDDIRVLPSNGNMKSFVYDQKTQRLMAELDENNYSTFYEYDLEGGLIRIKKETEKGVFTIQETRSGNVKK